MRAVCADRTRRMLVWGRVAICAPPLLAGSTYFTTTTARVLACGGYTLRVSGRAPCVMRRGDKVAVARQRASPAVHCAENAG
mmetsp:Transcript_1593/g.4052  ORF Transcript_1593/g.4052 Transcript_1593/m.4052 type:complete len:82 (-) Transcript_1593:389-634(-)